MKNKILLFIAAFGFYMLGYAQDPAPQLSTYVPVSPNAASLGKFGMYPVNYNLGTVNIGVPIYTINTGKQKLPISLSYHSSGIKVNELASWVGLGWTLNSGGAIIRNTKGIPDKKLGEPDIPDMDNYAFNQTNYMYLYKAFIGEKDMAPDEFVINAPGLSGTFYFDDNDEAVFRDYNQVDVEVISNQEVKITREDGTIMYFGASDSSANDIIDWIGGPPTAGTVTAWYLTKMIAPNSTDTITFIYKNKNNSDYPVAIGESAHFGNPHTGTIKGDYPDQRFGKKKYLEKIEFSNGYVQFNSSLNRPDLQDEYKLDNIKVYFEDADNNTTLVEEFTFDYSHFTRSGGFYPTGVPQGEIFTTTRMTNSREKALKLNKVIVGKGGAGHEYSFDYNTTPLPKRGSKKQDYWGYANDNSGSLLINTSLYIETYSPTGSGNYINYNVGNGNRKADPTKMKAASLEKITYPTGGSTEFEFEAYKYNATDYMGGLRIKTIKNYDGIDTNPASIKSFEYGSANILQPAGMNSYIKKYIYNATRNAPNAKVSTHSNYNNNIGGVPILEYGKITEYDLNTDTGVDNGKTEYTYETIATTRLLNGNFPVIYKHASATFAYMGSINQVQDLDHFSYYQPDLWQYGSLKKKEVFKRTGPGTLDFQKVTSTEHDYDVLGSFTLKSNVLFPIMMDPTDHWVDPPSPYNSDLDPISYKLSYFIEEVSLGKKALTQTIEKVYDENGTDYVETITDYDYNGQYLLSETKTTDSENKSIISKTYYPDDILSVSTLLGPDLSGYDKLVIDSLKSSSQHQITTPVQKETYLDTDGDGDAEPSELLSLQRTNFNQASGFVQPQTIQTLKGEYHATNNPLIERIKYHSYSSSGNPQEVSKTGGSHIVYLWSYNNSFPVAKIENSSYYYVDQAMDTQSTTFITDLGLDNDKSIVGGKLDLLRTTLAANTNTKDALVSTYVYDPLIGVVMETGPSGLNNHYQYDDFNRLKAVLNNNEDVVQYINYNYASDPELSLSISSYNFDDSSGSKSVTVTSNRSWTASESVSWLSISGGSGTNNGSFTINATTNTGTARSATVTVTADGVTQTVSVTQDAQAVNFNLSAITYYNLVSSFSNPTIGALEESDVDVYLGPHSHNYSNTIQIQCPDNSTYYIDYDNAWGWISPSYNSSSDVLSLSFSDPYNSDTNYASIRVTSGGVTKIISIRFASY